MRRIHISSIFRNFLAYLASFRNRTRVSDTASSSHDAPRSRSDRSLHSDTESIQGRLQELGAGRIPRRVDAKVLSPVQRPHTLEMEQLSKYEQDIDLPKSREEELAESTFEWIKTERAGDISRFKALVEENGVEYIVFQDNTRVNSALIGDVVMSHKNPIDLMTFKEDFDPTIAPELETKTIAGGHNETFNLDTPATKFHRETTATLSVSNPVHELLKKAKKSKQKVSLVLELEIPTRDIYRIVSDNFEDGDHEIVNFILADLDENAIKNALISALKDKYTKTTNS